jgi:hypothetical protein
VTLVVAIVLWIVWLRGGTYSFGTIVGAGVWLASTQFVMSAAPIRYGAGLGGPADSDGRAIWRILTGTPPGGLAREQRRLNQPERGVRPVYAALLAIAGVLALLTDPLTCLVLVALFGMAALLQRRG